MPFRKRSPGSCLEVTLKIDGTLLVSKLDRGDEFPRTQSRRVPRPARVVDGQSRFYVARQSDIEPIGELNALEDVDDTLRRGHIFVKCNTTAEPLFEEDSRAH